MGFSGGPAGATPLVANVPSAASAFASGSDGYFTFDDARTENGTSLAANDFLIV